ncbi:MAG: sensor histidine kinase [Ilumatobacteraceae bacterium]
MNALGAPRGDRQRWPVAGPVAQFAVTGVFALAIVAIATWLASGRVGEHEAVVDARSRTLVSARDVVEPVIVDGLAVADEHGVAAVDEVVRRLVLDESLIRVKIWRGDGTIVYSDEPRLIGTHYELGAEDAAALYSDEVEAEVSDLDKPENRFERDQGKLLEVYLPVHTPDGTPLLFEAYFRYDAVASSGSRVWRSFAPITIGSLLVLQIVQVPLAWRLARRLQQRRLERERLLQRAIDASDHERRRISGDLHDGVVQDLVGVAYSLASTARRPETSAATAALLDNAAAEVRESIKTLRSLLVEIYPPNLIEEGLPTALDDLLTRAHGRGVATELDTSGLDAAVSPSTAGLLYRVTQEALRNVLSHSRASTVRVVVAGDATITTLDVIDDGVGFDPSALATLPKAGHFGVQGLRDLVADAGGRFTIDSAPDTGCRLHVEVPVP